MHFGGPSKLSDLPNSDCLTSYKHSKSKEMEEEEEEEKIRKNWEKKGKTGRPLHLPRVIKNWFTIISLSAKSSISLPLPRGFSGGPFLLPSLL